MRGEGGKYFIRGEKTHIKHQTPDNTAEIKNGTGLDSNVRMVVGKAVPPDIRFPLFFYARDMLYIGECGSSSTERLAKENAVRLRAKERLVF